MYVKCICPFNLVKKKILEFKPETSAQNHKRMNYTSLLHLISQNDELMWTFYEFLNWNEDNN